MVGPSASSGTGYPHFASPARPGHTSGPAATATMISATPRGTCSSGDTVNLPQASATAPAPTIRPRLTFIGTGYLGATYAICFAELGYDVLGVDVDTAKIASLAGGQVPIH